MNEDFVSFEQAVKLKAAGFDVPCCHYYDIDDAPDGYYWEGSSLDKRNHNNSPLHLSAPTLSQVQKWLREVKRIAVSVLAELIRGELWYSSSLLSNEVDRLVDGGFTFNTYEQALSAGITAALELIEKKGE